MCYYSIGDLTILFSHKLTDSLVEFHCAHSIYGFVVPEEQPRENSPVIYLQRSF